MTKDNVQKRIEKLRKEINYHRRLYFVEDRQEISDSALDSLKHELSKLETAYPDLITPDSPTQRVGGAPLSVFKKVNHRERMLSLNDAFFFEEVHEWEERLIRLLGKKEWSYFVDVKFDGLAMSIVYEDGMFARAATRGDGSIGEDVTQNVRTIEAIPLCIETPRLAPSGVRPLADEVMGGGVSDSADKTRRSALVSPYRIEIRGEVIMTKYEFEKVNNQLQKEGKAPYANPRNLAAGSLRQLDPKITASRNLRFFGWDMSVETSRWDVSDSADKTRHRRVSTRADQYALLKSLGIPTSGHYAVCSTLDEVEKVYTKIEKMREKLPYWIDGIVVKVNEIDVAQKAGVVGKAPRGAVAWKFSAQEVTTVIQDIHVQVGRTGVLTPVALFEPVQVAGTRVTRATLHNQAEINRLDVRIGDTVIIRKAGDIIPEVVQVLPTLRPVGARAFSLPKVCPICHSSVEVKKIGKGEQGVGMYCTNKQCFSQRVNALIHCVSRGAFDITGLRDKIVELLVEHELVNEPADFFDITVDDLKLLEGFKDKKANNIIHAIQARKHIPFGQFIYALGIPQVGVQTARALAEHFNSLDALENASEKEFLTIEDIGPIVAHSIGEWFKDKHNKQTVDNLTKKITIEYGAHQQSSGVLKGKSFVFTGELSQYTRDEAEALVRSLGGKAVSAVSKNTDYVVVGHNPGSKRAQAEKLGVDVIDEEEFIHLTISAEGGSASGGEN